MSLDISAFVNDIEKAIQAGGNIWDNKLLDGFKSEVKRFYREKLFEQCCYCCRNTHGEFKMVLDIEHILPKSKFRHLMFSSYNLSVSCKRCNMSIKKDDVSFIKDMSAINGNPQDTMLYKFIHPNFDKYKEHLEYYTKTVNQQKIVKYSVVANSSKGQYTYDYFKLSELEIDTINKAQGINDSYISEAIDPSIAKKIEDLLKKKKK